jgi:hypothetical protein
MPPDDPSYSEHIRTLWAMISGYRTTQMITVIAQLGIADLLTDGPKDVEDLARRRPTRMSPPSTASYGPSPVSAFSPKTTSAAFV